LGSLHVGIVLLMSTQRDPNLAKNRLSGRLLPYSPRLEMASQRACRRGRRHRNGHGPSSGATKEAITPGTGAVKVSCASSEVLEGRGQKVGHLKCPGLHHQHGELPGQRQRCRHRSTLGGEVRQLRWPEKAGRSSNRKRGPFNYIHDPIDSTMCSALWHSLFGSSRKTKFSAFGRQRFAGTHGRRACGETPRQGRKLIRDMALERYSCPVLGPACKAGRRGLL